MFLSSPIVPPEGVWGLRRIAKATCSELLGRNNQESLDRSLPRWEIAESVVVERLE